MAHQSMHLLSARGNQALCQMLLRRPSSLRMLAPGTQVRPAPVSAGPQGLSTPVSRGRALTAQAASSVSTVPGQDDQSVLVSEKEMGKAEFSRSPNIIHLLGKLGGSVVAPKEVVSRATNRPLKVTSVMATMADDVNNPISSRCRFKLTFWNELADAAVGLQKDDLVWVTGALQQDTFLDRTTQLPRTGLSINVRSFAKVEEQPPDQAAGMQ